MNTINASVHQCSVFKHQCSNFCSLLSVQIMNSYCVQNTSLVTNNNHFISVQNPQNNYQCSKMHASVQLLGAGVGTGASGAVRPPPIRPQDGRCPQMNARNVMKKCCNHIQIDITSHKQLNARYHVTLVIPMCQYNEYRQHISRRNTASARIYLQISTNHTHRLKHVRTHSKIEVSSHLLVLPLNLLPRCHHESNRY